MQNAFDGDILVLEDKCMELLYGNSLAVQGARMFLTEEYGDMSYNEGCAKAVTQTFVNLISDKIKEEA